MKRGQMSAEEIIKLVFWIALFAICAIGLKYFLGGLI